MTFHKGYKCDLCGPIEKANVRTMRRIKRHTCPNCDALVHPWTRPENERSGRCRNCAGGAFKLAVVKGKMLRCCKRCDEVINTDSKKYEIIREGDKKHEYRKQTKDG